jgi:hypothetical protein
MVTKFASLATASALLLTAAPAAVADTSTGDVQFYFTSPGAPPDGAPLNILTIFEQISYDAETGLFAEFENANVQMSCDFSFFSGVVPGNGGLNTEPIDAQGWSIMLTITIEEVPNYGPMQIELELAEGWEYDLANWGGGFSGSYGPPAGFGEPATFAGNWTAQVVPAPGVASLLALTGLARRRRRD